MTSTTVGIDGKVFTSQLRTLETHRIDRNGHKVPIRPDDGRGQHHEGGGKEAVWGVKFAIAAIRSPLPGHRAITGIEHVPNSDGRGEPRAFVKLALAAGTGDLGIDTFVVDGALRGKAIDEIQTTTGAQVVSPPRRLRKSSGGIPVAGTYHAARTLPPSKARARAFADCDGHELWAAGSIYERVITSDGTEHYAPVETGQCKWQRLASGKWAVYVKQTLPCQHTGEIHTWWEPYYEIASDPAVGFNRAEYLRLVPRDSPEFARIYGMRADTESLNAQLEFSFQKQRIPAYGVHRQTIVMVFAAMSMKRLGAARVASRGCPATRPTGPRRLNHTATRD